MYQVPLCVTSPKLLTTQNIIKQQEVTINNFNDICERIQSQCSSPARCSSPTRNRPQTAKQKSSICVKEYVKKTVDPLELIKPPASQMVPFAHFTSQIEYQKLKEEELIQKEARAEHYKRLISEQRMHDLKLKRSKIDLQTHRSQVVIENTLEQRKSVPYDAILKRNILKAAQFITDKQTEAQKKADETRVRQEQCKQRRDQLEQAWVEERKTWLAQDQHYFSINLKNAEADERQRREKLKSQQKVRARSVQMYAEKQVRDVKWLEDKNKEEDRQRALLKKQVDDLKMQSYRQRLERLGVVKQPRVQMDKHTLELYNLQKEQKLHESMMKLARIELDVQKKILKE